MEQERIEELIVKYNEGQASDQEIKLIEQLIEDGQIELSQLRELTLLEEQVMKLEAPAPSTDLDDNFYHNAENSQGKK
jgi:hypothetical protein